jgi:hypothetical protein
MLKTFAAMAAAVMFLHPNRVDDLVAAKVATLPAIDGKAGDEAWSKAKELVVKIGQPGEENSKKKISIKAVHDGDSLCLLLVWSDPDKSDQHMPFVLKGNVYEADEGKIEDSCAVGFALEGKFDSDMLAGIESTWDLWEWCAARTAGGTAWDKTHIYTKTKPPAPLKSRRMIDRNKGTIFLARPNDEGALPYKKIEAPTQKGAPLVPQFQPQTAAGSAADVQTRGEWAGGKWTVEFRRKLNTGHKDDTLFDPAKSVPFAVAIFDKAEHSDHDVSGTLTLKFEK